MTTTKRLLVIVWGILLLCVGVVAQGPAPGSINAKRIYSGTAVPNWGCSPGPIWTDFYLRTTTDVLYYCSAAPSTWSVFATAGVSGTTINATDGRIPYRSSSTAFTDSPLLRVDTNTVAQKNTTTAQAFQVFNTDDGAGNAELLKIDFSTAANKATIETNKTGTGTNRNMRIQANGGFLELSDGNEILTLGSSALKFVGTNNYDLGSSASTWKTGYFGTSVIVPTVTAATSVTTPSLTINSGTAIVKHLSATATLDFASQVGVGCENLTITVTGAAVGDTVAIGIPNGSIVTNGVFYGWVSATNTVSIKFCAVVSGDPASGSFRADVWGH